MAEAFPFELVSPEKQLVSGEATEVLIPGTEGYFQVFANHAPVMSTIKPGVVEVKMADGESSRYVIFGGFADVSPAGLTLLAQHAVDVADLDKADLERRIQDAKEDLADAKDEEARAKAADYLDQLTTLQTAF
ncbi:F0F1 ATP synthase subunit epsilon [Salaquimonas pukyongi]|uniref:F0F1 ATP synthase subunit epsilon n=1 Tax=Salaquimonas pukyongi TaxID=2712698 RepID=UPI00096BD07D|nr:F0F1 ATP synthase subunit epsilon [Salaquimonas pukyongi]